MSVPYYGDFAEDDTVDMIFNAFTSDDPSASATITNFINTDVHIHKDLAVAQRNNAAGITVSVDFDGITGNHAIKIDTSDNTVAGFYVTGSEYQVRIEGTTVDGATVNAWVGSFSIERAGGTVALLKLIQAAVITNAAGADVAADIIAVKAETALIVGDTNELQTDDIPGTLATIAGYLDTEIAAIVAAVITNAAGVDIAADIIALKAETALIVGDTNELQADDVPTLIAALPTAVEIQAEMEENGASILDTIRDDLADGGRLDLLIDAIKAITDALPDAGALDDLATILADTNELQADDIPAAIAALPDAAAINAEVVDALNVDTYVEPGQEAPGATVSLAKKISYLYKFLRNKITNDGTTIEVNNDAGDTVDQKSTVSETAGTVTRGKFGAGP